MPSQIAVQGSGARVNWKNWGRHRTDDRYNAPYQHHDEYMSGRLLAREDVFAHFAKHSTRKGIISAIKWGYPRGKMPGGAWRGLSEALRSDDLVDEIDALLAGPSCTAKEIIQRLNKHVTGISTATTTKLAYFAGLTAAEGPCLIYDSMVRRAIRVRSDREFAALKASPAMREGAPEAQQAEAYCLYLQAVGLMAERLGVQGDQIELFLFNGREDADKLPPFP